MSLESDVKATIEEIERLQKEKAKIAADLLYKDSHSWSTRGCSTCLSISTILGFDFGCIRFAKERKG